MATLVAGIAVGAWAAAAPQPLRQAGWTPLSEVSPLMRRATLLQEEKLPERVAQLELGSRGEGLGGTVRLKARALKLRWLYSPDELLEACLNLSNYGGSIVGVEDAARIYFDKNPDQLNLSEALTLSVIPRHPLRRTLLGGNVADFAVRWKARRGLKKKLSSAVSDRHSGR